MNIRLSLVIPVSSRAICDCGGELFPTGVSQNTMPPTYSHLCRECKRGKLLSKVYPSIEYLTFSGLLTPLVDSCKKLWSKNFS